MDDYAAYAFRDRVVRFTPTGKLRKYNLFLAYSTGVIPVEQLVVRLQSAAGRWGLMVRLTGSDERELAFEVATAG